MADVKKNLAAFDRDVPAIRDTDVYSVHDWTTSPLKHLVPSMTFLNPGQQTNGHSHIGAEEVYVFVSGLGQMKLGEEIIDVGQDDVIAIESGIFHQVINSDSVNKLIFFCVFEKYAGRD